MAKAVFEDVMEKAQLPAANWRDLSPAWLEAAIDRRGAALVRGLLPLDECARLAQGVERAFDASDAESGDEWFTPFSSKTSGLTYARAWVREHGGVYAADSPKMLGQLIDVYRRHGVVDWVGDYLKERPVLSSHKTTLRITRPDTPNVGWHQDGAFLGEQARVLNIWVALTHCGEHAAGLDVALRRQSRVVGAGEDGAAYEWSVSDMRARREGGRIVTPVMQPGDALLFDHLCLHRTSTRPATETRLAIEAWFFAPSTLPEDYDAIPV